MFCRRRQMINLDIAVPEELERDMVHCCNMLKNEEFAEFVAQRYPLEHKLYTELALKIHAERAPDALAALTDEFCRACIIVINVSEPAFRKFSHGRLLSEQIACESAVAAASAAAAAAAAAASAAAGTINNDAMN